MNSYAHFNNPMLHRPVELANYMSNEFTETLDRLGLRRSGGRTGICFDNAMAESFFGALKNERVSRMTYLSREAARQDITRYIE
jgi:transposase InsO family protein